jgi:hypothetical protein
MSRNMQLCTLPKAGSNLISTQPFIDATGLFVQSGIKGVLRCVTVRGDCAEVRLTAGIGEIGYCIYPTLDDLIDCFKIV